jgi:hypothetical protein
MAYIQILCLPAQKVPAVETFMILLPLLLRLEPTRAKTNKTKARHDERHPLSHPAVEEEAVAIVFVAYSRTSICPSPKLSRSPPFSSTTPATRSVHSSGSSRRRPVRRSFQPLASLQSRYVFSILMSLKKKQTNKQQKNCRTALMPWPQSSCMQYEGVKGKSSDCCRSNVSSHYVSILDSTAHRTSPAPPNSPFVRVTVARGSIGQVLVLSLTRS